MDPHEIDGVRWGTVQELCGPIAEAMLATGAGLFLYRVAMHREAALRRNPEHALARANLAGAGMAR